jgi:hypothetical protein
VKGAHSNLQRDKEGPVFLHRLVGCRLTPARPGCEVSLGRMHKKGQPHSIRLGLGVVAVRVATHRVKQERARPARAQSTYRARE